MEGSIVQISRLTTPSPDQLNSSAKPEINITSRGLSPDSRISYSSRKWDPMNYQDNSEKKEQNGYLFNDVKSAKDVGNIAKAPFSQLNDHDANAEYSNENTKSRIDRLIQLSETGASSPSEERSGEVYRNDLSFKDENQAEAPSQENNDKIKREPMADTTRKVIRKKEPDVIKPYEKTGQMTASPKPKDDFRVKFNTWIFRCLILVVILTEIITTPTPMMADSAIVQSLVETDSEYGKQRLFGSLGLSLAAILVAVWVSLATDCLHTDTINYLPCFYLFEIAIGATVLVSLFVKFDRPLGEENVTYEFLDAMKLFKNFRNGVFLVTLFAFGFFHSLHYSFLFLVPPGSWWDSCAFQYHPVDLLSGRSGDVLPVSTLGECHWSTRYDLPGLRMFTQLDTSCTPT